MQADEPSGNPVAAKPDISALLGKLGGSGVEKGNPGGFNDDFKNSLQSTIKNAFQDKVMRMAERSDRKWCIIYQEKNGYKVAWDIF